MKRAILLVDHGSRREQANALLEEVAALLRKRSDDVSVHTAHMELSPPNIQEGFDACVADAPLWPRFLHVEQRFNPVMTSALTRGLVIEALNSVCPCLPGMEKLCDS